MFYRNRWDENGHENVWRLSGEVYTWKCIDEEEEERRRRSRPRGDGGGLLGPAEGTVICNIHSNVPYQMQRARRSSGMEMSLVLCSALVTARADPDKWIQADGTYGVLMIQRSAWLRAPAPSNRQRFISMQLGGDFHLGSGYSLCKAAGATPDVKINTNRLFNAWNQCDDTADCLQTPLLIQKTQPASNGALPQCDTLGSVKGS